MLTLTGPAAVAAALYCAYSLGWVCATAVSASLQLQTRTVVRPAGGDQRPLGGTGTYQETIRPDQRVSCWVSKRVTPASGSSFPPSTKPLSSVK